MKSAESWKVELWDEQDYIITGFANQHPSTFTRREAELIQKFIHHVTPLIQQDAIQSCLAIVQHHNVNLMGGETAKQSIIKALMTMVEQNA